MSTAIIIDDHALFAEALVPMLRAEGIDVLAIVTHGNEVRDSVRAHGPDVALVDLHLVDEHGDAVGNTVLEESPATKVIALAEVDDPRAVKEAMRSGFHGYISKDTPAGEFLDGVRAVLGGQVLMPHRLAAQAMGARSAHEREVALMAEQLTPRELDVLALLVEGAAGDTIARRLAISPNTVRTHVHSILTKLQVHSRLEAVTFAVRYRIVEPPKAQVAR